MDGWRIYQRIARAFATACAFIFAAPASAHETGQVEIGMTSYGYMNPVLLNRSVGLAAVQARVQYDRPNFQLDAQAIGSGYIGADSGADEFSYWFEANELAWKRSLGNVDLSVGRKKFQWSRFDEQWGLGIWQARNRWDYLQVSQVALTGVQAQWNSGDVQATVFASPLFIPERGPSLSLRDGVFYPSNAWPGSPPSRSPLINGIDTDIRYQLEMPAMSKILLNPSVAAQFRYGRETTWISASYAYKPINQIALAYDGYFNLDEGRADARVFPRIAYHHVGELEAGARVKQWSAVGSVTRELPKLGATPSTWTAQTLPSSTLVGGSIALDTAKRRASVSYLKRFGAAAIDQGPQASGSNSVFESRVLFEEAIAAEVAGAIPGLRADRFQGRARAIYAFDTEGTVLGTEANYSPTPNWRLGLGADLLASKAPGNTRDFATKYRAHDRVYGGLSYVF